VREAGPSRPDGRLDRTITIKNGTPFVLNYNSFDFIDLKFDYLSYSKNLC
jgi:hypothetical protein